MTSIGKTPALPLRRGASNLYGPWIVAAAIYAAVLALAAAMAAPSVERSWEAGFASTISVRIPASAIVSGNTVAEITGLLRAIPAVEKATPAEQRAALPDPASAGETALVGPPSASEFGTVAGPPPAAHPASIDIRLRPGARLDIEALEVALNAAAPGTRIDVRDGGAAEMVRFARAFQAFGAALAALFGLVAAATVIFAVRAELAAHRETIGVLRLIGARDSRIARKFVGQAASVAIKGGIVGSALAAATAILLAYFMPPGNALVPSEIALSRIQWAALACLPLAAAAVGMAAARITAMRTLSRMA